MHVALECKKGENLQFERVTSLVCQSYLKDKVLGKLGEKVDVFLH